MELCIREGKEGWCCPAVFRAYEDCLYQPDWEKFCRVAQELKDDMVRLLRAERGEQVLGACAVRQYPEGRAEILGIGTAPESRRQGIGRQMVAFLQRDERITALEAETDGEAVDFYRRCGFAAEAHQKRYPNGVVTRYRCTWERT